MSDEEEKISDYYASGPLLLDRHEPIISSHFLADVCHRRVWSVLRRVKKGEFNLKRARTVMIREKVGQHLLEECRQLGWIVNTAHPKTRLPIVFKDEHLEIRMSALGKDPSGERAGWFLIQVEVVQADFLQEIIEKGVKTGHPALYAHCQLGLGYSHLKECAVYLSSLEGSLYIETVKFESVVFEHYAQLARNLYESRVAPPRVETKECWSCTFKDACYDHSFIPNVACQTCCQAELKEGGIFCRYWKRMVDEHVWEEGCSEHVFIPDLLSFAKKRSEKVLPDGGIIVSYDLEDGGSFSNGGSKNSGEENLYTSNELVIGGSLIVNNSLVRGIKEHFAGSKIVKTDEKE